MYLKIRYSLWGLTVLGVICVAYTLYWHEPTANSWYPRCFLHQYTGLHCPGCGGTRASHLLLHGHWWAAVQMNPLLIIGLPIILAGCAWQKCTKHIIPGFSQIVLWIVLLFFAIRNIPSPTTSWFAPTDMNSKNLEQQK
jgi:hypothetical protein